MCQFETTTGSIRNPKWMLDKEDKDHKMDFGCCALMQTIQLNTQSE